MTSAVLLPEWVERRLETAPVHSDKRGLAQLLTSLFGPISYRTIEDRPFGAFLIAMTFRPFPTAESEAELAAA